MLTATQIEHDTSLDEFLSEKEYLLVVPGTLEEFYKLDEKKADFINGQIYLHMAASFFHELLVSQLIAFLGAHALKHNLGHIIGSRLAVCLEADFHPEPDIVFIATDNPGKRNSRGFDGVPDMIAEVFSPSTKRTDLDKKRPFYQQHGVPEIYFIDTEKREFIVDLKTDDGYRTQTLSGGTYRSRVLEGYVWQIDDLFKIADQNKTA